MKEKIATTVKIERILYDSFKILGIQNNLTLQTFVEKCVNLYVGDTSYSSSFRDIVHTYSVPSPKISGSFGS